MFASFQEKPGKTWTLVVLLAAENRFACIMNEVNCEDLGGYYKAIKIYANHWKRQKAIKGTEFWWTSQCSEKGGDEEWLNKFRLHLRAPH